MKRALIVYYSRTGKTKKAVVELQKQLQCDVEELVDNKNRRGILGWIISGRDAAMSKGADIQPISHNPEQYDIVILGTPIWASNVSSAVRTYIDQNKVKFKRVAFLATAGGDNDKIFNRMSELCGKTVSATCLINSRSLKSGAWKDSISEFVKNIG